MKILLLSRYANLGASSRLRALQYLPFLKDEGIDVTVAPLLDNNYVKSLYSGKSRRVKDIFSLYLSRFISLLKSFKFDLLWIEKELFPWVPALVESIMAKIHIPYAVDYDDPTFHTYDKHASDFVRTILGNKIDSVMRQAKLVLVGNEYLGQRAREAGAPWVEVLPTVIDLDRYILSPPREKDYFSIGWIGTPITERYLKLIEPTLVRMYRSAKRIKLVMVGAQNVILEGIPMQFLPWSEYNEVSYINNFDVGIMPLPDEYWERGKCGYKLIQYMACSKPVIASPVGINKEIVEHSINGFLPNNADEWIESLMRLYSHESLRISMGAAGREKVKNRYCIQVTSGRLAMLLKAAAKS